MKLEEIKKLCDEASPAELWGGYVPCNEEGTHWYSIGPTTFGMEQAIKDGEFMAAARTLLPAALDRIQIAIRRLKSIGKAHLQGCAFYVDHPCDCHLAALAALEADV